MIAVPAMHNKHNKRRKLFGKAGCIMSARRDGRTGPA